jgi:hypothetical protein
LSTGVEQVSRNFERYGLLDDHSRFHRRLVQRHFGECPSDRPRRPSTRRRSQ